VFEPIGWNIEHKERGTVLNSSHMLLGGSPLCVRCQQER
jgi:hypothetical protein